MRHLARGTTIWNLSEPPAEPDLVDQKDALRKGLGRAALWAQAGQLDHALLHAACLSDWRYDKQSDDNRATYLWKLLELTGMRDELRFPVLHRLGESVDPDITWQMYGLAYQYASAGDTLHRQAIYAHYARLCRLDKGWSPDGYVLALDGFAGFEFCLAQRAAALRSRDWVWEDEALISTAKEEFGQDRIDRYLDESRDPDIIRFRDRLRLEGHSDENTPSVNAIPQVESLDEVRAWLDSPVGEHPRYLAFRYRATDEDRQHVLEWIQSETDVRRIARMFNLLGSRELPRFDANLLRFCLHPDAEVRRNASRAIGRSQHPTIREFAMGQVDSGITDEAVMELLWQNAEPGDCERLIHVFRLETDDDKRHGQLMNVNGILERCPADEGFPLALIAYRNNPCGYCRWSIVEHLAECELAPEWLIEECRFDAQADTRDAFE